MPSKAAGRFSTQWDKIISVGDLPVVGAGAQRLISGPLCASIIERFTPSVAIIERVGPMPRQGVSSTFKFGRGLGVIEGVLGGCDDSRLLRLSRGVEAHFHLGKDKEAAEGIEIWPSVGRCSPEGPRPG